MKWNLGWTITTKSVHDKTYRIEIYTQDSVSEVIELMPAKIAFEYKTENDEDPYTSIRGSVGTIRFITQRKRWNSHTQQYYWDNIDYWGGMMLNETDKIRPKRDRDRLVRVLVEGSLIWVGFLSCEEYTGELLSRKIIREIEIPCKSIMESTKDIPMDIYSAKYNFAGLLIESLCKTADIEENELDFILNKTYCAWDSQDTYILTQNVSSSLYMKIEDREVVGKPYHEVLSDSLFFNDYQLVEYFGSIYIVKFCDTIQKTSTGYPDSRMIRIESKESLKAISDGSQTPTTHSHLTKPKEYTQNSDIEGKDNEVLIRKPIGSVVVSTQKPDLFDFDFKCSSDDFISEGGYGEFGERGDERFCKLNCTYSSPLVSMSAGIKTKFVDRWDVNSEQSKSSYSFHPEFQFTYLNNRPDRLRIELPTIINANTVTEGGGFVLKFSLTEFNIISYACRICISIGDQISYREEGIVGERFWEEGLFYQTATFKEDKTLTSKIGFDLLRRGWYNNAEGGIIVFFTKQLVDLIRQKNINGKLSVTIENLSPICIKDLSIETLIQNDKLTSRFRNWHIKDGTIEKVIKNSDNESSDSITYNYSCVVQDSYPIKTRQYYLFDTHGSFKIHMKKKTYVKIGNLYLRFPYFDERNIEHGIFPLSYIMEDGRKLRLLTHSLNSYNDNGECLFLDTNFYEE